MVKMISKDRKLVVLQYAATITVSLTTLGYGAFLTWTSPTLPYLTSNKVEKPLLIKQFDVITSLATVGCFCGYFINPPFTKLFGTKYTLLLFALPQIVSWVMIVKSKSFTFICLSRILGGIGYGGAICTITEYITEISNFGNRGKLFSFNNLFMGMGNLLPILYGTYLSYYYMNIALMIIPIIFFVIFFLLPDSSFFMEMNKIKEEEITRKMKPDFSINGQIVRDLDVETGSKSFSKLGAKIVNDTDRVETERVDATEIGVKLGAKIVTTDEDKTVINDDVKSVNDGISRTTLGLNGQDSLNGSETCLGTKAPPKTSNTKNVDFFESSESVTKNYNFKESELWKLFTLPNNRRSLMILIWLSGTDIFGGHLPVSTYTQQFLTHRGTVLSPEVAALVLSIIRLLAIVVSTQIVERIGKKNLLLWSGIAGSISYALSGVFFFLDSRKYDISHIGWFPICWLTIAEVANAVGVGNTFYALQGELFPNDVKSMAISVTNIIYMIFGFLALMKFQELMDFLGIYVIFWFFSVCFVLFPFIIFIVAPETRGKSLLEIQEELKKVKKSKLKKIKENDDGKGVQKTV